MAPSCAAGDVSLSASQTNVTELQHQFDSSPYWPLRQISCGSRQGRIFVRGAVTSFYMKQLAVSLATKVAGVGRVEIDIDVRPE